MPEHTEVSDPLAATDRLADRLHAAQPGLAALLAEAQRTWVSRARDPEAATPGWRPFEDAFPTFYQFTNRPR
jgi:hypothetical protein